MTADRLTEIEGPAGALEALLDLPARGQPVRAAAVLGHPHPLHGGTMHTKVVYRTAKTLVSLGCAVLRFNFRGVGRSAGRFDEADGERDDFAAALAFMHERHAAVPLYAGGMSFGAYVAMVAGEADARVETLLGIAAPIERYDFSPLARSRKRKYFIHGERDEICSLDAVTSFVDALPEPKRLVVVDDAVHLFTSKELEVVAAIRSLFGETEEHHA